MCLDEMIAMFIDSRKRGVDGAKRRCTEKTIKIYRDNLRTFGSFLMSECDGISRYESIKRMHIMQFSDWMEGKKKAGDWSEATVIQILGSLRTFFRWVDKDEDCQLHELKGLQRYLPLIGKKPRRTDIPQRGELRKFRNFFNTESELGYRNFVAVTLLTDTGMRLGELCNLHINQIRFEEKLIIVNGKTGPRPVPMSDEVIRILKVWLKRRVVFETAKDSPYLFVSSRSPKMDVAAFGKNLRAHRAKFGLPRITAHSIRHMVATNTLRDGMDMEKVRLLMGHSSYEMLRGYLHLANTGSKDMQKEHQKHSLLSKLNED